jgi:glycosyltransferase involved in cell wall biosynthesis
MNKLSIIVSVYDKIRELDLVLSALKVQSFKDFEIIIADDGSGEEMQKFIQDLSKSGTIEVNHVSHEHRGFRKNAILNKAIGKASTPYLIFLDGDCVPHFDFVKHHFERKQNNTVLCGRRVNLSKRLSDEITKAGLLNKKDQKIKLKHFIDSLIRKEDRSTYVEHGIVVENKLVRKFFKMGLPRIVGCNFSIPISLIEMINGFDENYIGPGIGEDADIDFRLKLVNVKFYSLRNLAVVFHLYHKPTMIEKNNYDYYLEMLNKKEAVCRNGIVKLT